MPRWWLLWLATPIAWGQQDPTFTQYMYNRFGLNPAAAGYAGAWQIVGVGRLQWIGIEGHPSTFMLNAHTPVSFLRGGIGLQLMGDQIGPFRTTDIKLAYAFRIAIGTAGSALQIGIAGGILNKSLDGAALRPEQIPDPTLFNRMATLLLPDIAAGIYFTLPDDRFYVGVASTHLTEPSLKEFTSTGRSRIPRHIYATSGYTFNLSEPVRLTPSVFFKTAGSQLSVDANLSLSVDPVVIGASYRLQDAASLLVGLQATEALFIGYSYDYVLSRLGAFTSGSHELVVRYSFSPAFRLLAPDLGVRDKKDFR